MHFAWSPRLAFAALVIEALAGYPDALYRAIGHPVTWMGAWLAALDRRLNQPKWSLRSPFCWRRSAALRPF
jgi:adenosylcobinamide-phosphate synthase